MNPTTPRQADYPIEPQFLARWSPRAFTGEPLPREALMSLFEAARWAPSSGNSQPWKFLYALPGTLHWERYQGLLAEGNRAWTKDASALVLIVSKQQRTTKDGKVEPMRTHSFDAGSAWMALALQATALGWATHGMAGLDYERAASELKVAADYAVEMMLAVGRQGDPATLPEKLREREVPNTRRPVGESINEGDFA